MAFSTPYAGGTNVIVTLGVRDQGSALSNNNCLATVANASEIGFTLQWRNLNGDPCPVRTAVTVYYFAVPAR